ncbi:MAG: putative methylase [Thermoproteota archaeon]|nr:putative methylase [Thermoproteota archaeon]
MPEDYQSWQKMLAGIDENLKDIVKDIEVRVIGLGGVKSKLIGRYYGYYKGSPSTKSLFVVFLLTKKALRIRIRVDRNTFKDPKKWTGAATIFDLWFFKQGQEQEFEITNRDQIDYAMELIQQSYEVSST